MTDSRSGRTYDDIIGLTHPTSARHPRMSLYDRAAQFAPFSALTGHRAAIGEADRLTEEKIELSEDEIERLNEKLRLLMEYNDRKPSVTITYFVPDERKSGGTYVSHSGIVKKIDEYRHTITMEDHLVIPIEEICDIYVAM